MRCVRGFALRAHDPALVFLLFVTRDVEPISIRSVLNRLLWFKFGAVVQGIRRVFALQFIKLLTVAVSRTRVDATVLVTNSVGGH